LRPGLYQCNDCREQYTVTVGTVFERSKIGLHKWVLAAHLMGASKKGISSKQMQRMLGITYKSAWFMTMRLREAVRDEGLDPIGGEGKTVESDETFVGDGPCPPVWWQRPNRNADRTDHPAKATTPLVSDPASRGAR
jgi:hypothetical protein